MTTTTTTPDLDLETATPAQIDSALFPLWAERWTYATWRYSEKQRLANFLFPAEARRRDRYALIPHVLDVPRIQERLAAHDARLAEIAAAIAPIDAEFERRGGWSRYLFVQAGHLHRSGCSTLRPTTQTYLFAEASGLDAEEIVAKFTFTACTKCWKDAPVRTADVDPNVCPGSGKGASPIDPRAYRMYAKCPSCGETVAVTKNWNVRKHNKPEGAK